MFKRSFVPAVLVLLAGCPPEEEGCAAFDEVFVWVDADGDGFGGEERDGYICPGPGGALPANRAANNADCDDANDQMNPGMEEACDLLDNDCDGAIDESQPKVPWYRDADGDGYGSDTDVQSFCKSPGEDWLTVSGDCDDANRNINPLAIEVCNDGIDDDCDGYADDADGGVDPTTYTRWHVDADSDGYGSRDVYVDRCVSPNPLATTDGSDCDDAVATINPTATEVCNRIDDDCDDLIDDQDPGIDPATQDSFFADADGDGYGNPAVLTLACEPIPGIGVPNSNDCDDADPWANIDQNWYLDTDGDGAGSGLPLVYQCLRPAPDAAPEANGVDCEPDDSTIYPGAVDLCGDGVDQDCSGSDQCTSCKAWRDGLATPASGVYTVEPVTGNLFDVYCDMDTDGGGWTLVGSTRSTTMDDAGGSWHPDLTTLSPSSGHSTVWNGLRPVITAGTGRSDIRFACKVNNGASVFDVDLSFYSTIWYSEITTGTDTQSCFNENNGAGADPPPERRNNLNGTVLAAGNAYASGYLEGEDSCSDSGDFTVDFDDRGMDSNQSDGTDWGEDDSSPKCGTSGLGQSWFIFVREP